MVAAMTTCRSAFQRPAWYTVESGWSATIAYTYSDARQNNVSGDIGGYAANYNQYLFDLPYPKDYPMLPSNAVAEQRLVMTYSHDIPWDLVVGRTAFASPPRSPVDGTYGCPTICNQYGSRTKEVSKTYRRKPSAIATLISS